MEGNIDDLTLSLDYELKRYEDLYEHTRTIAINHATLTDKEKQLFFSGVESFILQEKHTLKVLNDSAKQKTQEFAVALKDQRKRISTNLIDYYRKIWKFVTDTLLPNAVDSISSIEYRRFTCYISTLVYPYLSNEEKIAHRGKTLESFNQALYLAKSALKPWDELYCELVLNYSAFQYICFGNVREAIIICQDTLYDIINSPEHPEISAKSKRIMQAMVENITAWANAKN